MISGHLITKLSIGTLRKVSSAVPILTSIRLKNSKSQHIRKPSVAKIKEKWVPNKEAHFTSNGSTESSDAQGTIPANDVSVYPIDDSNFTYIMNENYRYPLQRALELHLEMSKVLNFMGHYFVARLELEMTTDKKNRYHGNIRDLVLFPHYFEDGPTHNVILICQRQQHRELAKQANCFLCGHDDILKKFQAGEILDYNYDYLLCTPDVYSDVVKYRKKINPDRFPTLKNGRLITDVKAELNRFTYGKLCESSKVRDNAALLRVNFGTPSMEVSQLADNFHTLVNEIERMHNPPLGNFVKFARISFPPSTENFAIDLTDIIIKDEEDMESNDKVSAS